MEIRVQIKIAPICSFSCCSQFVLPKRIFSREFVYSNAMLQQHNTTPRPAHLILSPKDARTYLPQFGTQMNATLPAASIHVNFPCTDRIVQHLRQHAKCTKVSKLFDVFYDGAPMTLIANNCWLRYRNQRNISMKRVINPGLNEDSESLPESWIRFYELDDQQSVLDEVKQLLVYKERITKSRSHKSLDALDVAWLPFAHFPFIRHKFETEYGTIYIDEMAVSDKCDDFYVVGTIKIHHSQDIPKVLAFLEAMELNSGPARSKVVEWLFVKKPDIYKKLVARGIVNDLPYQSEHYKSPPISQDLAWFKDYAFILEYGSSNETSPSS